MAEGARWMKRGKRVDFPGRLGQAGENERGRYRWHPTMNISLPGNERRRLEVLWKHDLLDTPPEQPLDDLTELAAHICGTPIAMISLVDEKRQWFKSRIGLTETETAREISFCTHAILQKDVMVVPDATRDPRFANSPLVTASPFIRFYAGAPLITEDGYALGTLCVVDREPREITDKQVKALKTLARVAMNYLQLRRQIREYARVPIQQKQPAT
jgi:two-component system, NtrC family, sensor kinase